MLNSNNNNASYFDVMFFFILSIVAMNIFSHNIVKDIKESQPEKYKVYYEYNVINKDTIPCDTIYIPIK